MRVHWNCPPRAASGQPINRSQTLATSVGSPGLASGGIGDARVISNAPPFMPRRMFTVRILPPESIGNRYREATNRRRPLRLIYAHIRRSADDRALSALIDGQIVVDP